MEYGYRGEIHVFEFMLQWDKLFQAHHPDPIIYMYRLICELPKFVKLKAGRVQIPLWPVPLVYSRVPKTNCVHCARGWASKTFKCFGILGVRLPVHASLSCC
jgi:hypothetical protein